MQIEDKSFEKYQSPLPLQKELQLKCVDQPIGYDLSLFKNHTLVLGSAIVNFLLCECEKQAIASSINTLLIVGPSSIYSVETIHNWNFIPTFPTHISQLLVSLYNKAMPLDIRTATHLPENLLGPYYRHTLTQKSSQLAFYQI